MSPELAESITLGIAASWMVYLYRSREAGRVVLFSALYLGLPAIALGIQAAGLINAIEPAKWIVVTTNAAITAAMIASTRHVTNPTIQALIRVEADRIRKAMVVTQNKENERDERIEVRGKVYAIAALLYQDVEPLRLAP